MFDFENEQFDDYAKLCSAKWRGNDQFIYFYIFLIIIFKKLKNNNFLKKVSALVLSLGPAQKKN